MGSVSGTVTYQGKALEKAQVVFHSESNGLAATGWTDAKGRYRLGTRSIDDGAMLGKYRVTVAARGPDKTLPGPSTSGMPGGNIVPGDPLIPEKYFMPDKSGLSTEVKPGGNTYDIDLK